LQISIIIILCSLTNSQKMDSFRRVRPCPHTSFWSRFRKVIIYLLKTCKAFQGTSRITSTFKVKGKEGNHRSWMKSNTFKWCSKLIVMTTRANNSWIKFNKKTLLNKKRIRFSILLLQLLLLKTLYFMSQSGKFILKVNLA
jgi:hypothetical protein